MFFSIFNEAYFGKTKNLLEIEKLIQSLRNKYGTGKDVGTLTIGFGSVESDPDWKKIQDLFCDEFGFTSCYMTLMRTVQPNAYTYPISIETNKASTALKDIVVKKNGVGIRYSKKCTAHFYVCVASSLLFDERYTPGECVAIILHEVGHNFQHLAYNHLGRIQNALYIFYLMLYLFCGYFLKLDLLQIVSSDFKEFVLNFKKSFRANFPTAKEAIDFISNILKNIIAVLPLSNVLSLVNLASDLKNGIDPSSILAGYAGEQAADRFTSYYGYGAELTSALAKLKITPIGTERIISQIPLIGSLCGFEKVIFMAIITMFSPHPQFTARYNAVKSELEYNLERSGLSRDAKKAIEKQIEEVDEAYRVSLEITPEEGFGESMAKRALKLLSLNPKGDIISRFYSKGSDFDSNYELLQKESGTFFNLDKSDFKYF